MTGNMSSFYFVLLNVILTDPFLSNLRAHGCVSIFVFRLIAAHICLLENFCGPCGSPDGRLLSPKEEGHLVWHLQEATLIAGFPAFSYM